MAKTTNQQRTKDNPKVPMSFRVPSELKDTLKQKAALEGKKLSDYLSEIVEDKLLNDEPKVLFDKEEPSLLKEISVKKSKEEFISVDPTTPIPETKTNYDEELVLHIEPHLQENYHRYINHLRQEYHGSVSDVIVAALISVTEDEHRLSPKPFNHYLEGLSFNRYANSQPYAEPIQTINYRKVGQYLFCLVLFLFLVREIKVNGFL